MKNPSDKPSYTDLREAGRGPDGQPIYSERRLFMQLLVFRGASPDTPAAMRDALADCGMSAVVYADVNTPDGVALLTMTETPAEFVTILRPILQQAPFDQLELRPDFTMMGRSYAIGYERDLDRTLVDRPRGNALNPEWPWAVWYPLRRTGAFARLEMAEQRAILGEHGTIGRAFGEANLAHDIRLAAHGMIAGDADFVVALVGPELMPLSAVVQTMRGTRQTGEFMDEMGPFFVGHVFWQSPSPATGGQTGSGQPH